MSLTPALLAVLACPSDDHAPLRLAGAAGTESLVCTYCATTYPIRDGIPVLLVDDATPGPNGIGVAAPTESATSESAASESAAREAAPAGTAPTEPAPARTAPHAPRPGPGARVTVESIVDQSPIAFDPSLSPRHALPDDVEADPAVEGGDTPAQDDSPEAAAPAADAAPADAAPAVPAAAEPAPAPASGHRLVDGLRGRVQQRLAEIEATRGSRPRRRGGR